MYIVINGGGKVGSYLGRTLTNKGHTVAVIEKRPEILEKLAEELPTKVLLIEGDGCDVKFQEDAGVGMRTFLWQSPETTKIISSPANWRRAGLTSSARWPV